MNHSLFTTPDDLRARIGRPDAPLLIDVRIPEDTADDPMLIPGARQIAHTALEEILTAAQGAQQVVVLCQRGAKLSQGVAAALRWRGVLAQALAGGTTAWAAAGYPVIPLSARPRGALVTGLRDGQDVLALWTLRRWAAPEAEVWVVDPPAVAEVADRFNATPVTDDAVRALGLGLPSMLHETVRNWHGTPGASRTAIDAACAWVDDAYAAQVAA